MKNLALLIVAGCSISACVNISNNRLPDVVGFPTQQNGAVVTEYPVETALLNIYTQPRTETLSAAEGEQNSVIDVKVTPKGTMTFEGKRVQGAERAYVTRVNGKVVSNSASTNYYTLNPTRFYGYTDSSGEYSVATQTADIPKVAKVGDSGALITENVYSDSSKRIQTSRYKQSWSLAQASPTTAWFCINTSQDLLAVSSDGTTAECYNINAKGDILSSRTTISVPTSAGTQTVTYTSR